SHAVSTYACYTLALHDALPISYVRTAMSDDLYGVIGAAMASETLVSSTGEMSPVISSASHVVEFPALHEPAAGDLGFSTSVGKQDRKSTRLTSSHVSTSYAVFC